ncbi:hypothetical protein CsatA_008550 [Cannabis sativa]
MNSGYTLVNFRDEATRDIVLETGVIHFDKKPVVIRPWTTDIDSLNLVKSVPIWIRLNGLGLQYWGKNTLSALVSTVGKPIMIDKVTSERSMIKFARVLVDMPIQDKPPSSISFFNERKQLTEQQIEYEWLPTSCAACGLLGHNISTCAKDKGLTWVKKNKTVQEKKGKEVNKISNDHNFALSTEKTLEKEGKMAKTIQGDIKEGSTLAECEGQWITPRRKGNKKQTAGNGETTEMQKATSSNTYEVLQEPLDEIDPLNNSMLDGVV